MFKHADGKVSLGALNISSIIKGCENVAPAVEMENNIYKLLEMKERQRKETKQQYQIHYNACANRINDALGINKDSIIFEVPEMMSKYPEYSASECIEFIDKKIKKLGMDTIIVSDSVIFISWAYIEENRQKSS